MAILLLAEHDNTILSEQTARTVTAARAIGGELHVLVLGVNADPVAQQAAKLEGVSRVLLANGQQFAGMLAEPAADLLVSLAPGYDTILAAATSNGKNIVPRVAALLDVMQVSDIIAVLAPDTFKRPIYAGNAIQTVQATDATRVITVRATSFAATGAAAPAPIETLVPTEASSLSRLVEGRLSISDRPELTSARVVVSGGRALGSAEQFQHVLAPLADTLGAALGASRAAVDAGYAPNDWQVGQTGKVVAPQLYIAIGISGAIQHLAGMQDARVIVAINKDPDAPICQIADLTLIGDLFTLVPELTRALGA